MKNDAIISSGLALVAAFTIFGGSCSSCDQASAVFNEVMPANTKTLADDAGEYDDWIEIYNNSTSRLDLAGYRLTDDVTESEVYALPAGLVIEPQEVLLLWADANPEQGDNHLPFNLNKGGEVILFKDPDGKLLDRIEYTDALPDQVFARFPDGTGKFSACFSPSPGALNGDHCREASTFDSGGAADAGTRRDVGTRPDAAPRPDGPPRADRPPFDTVPITDAVVSDSVSEDAITPLDAGTGDRNTTDTQTAVDVAGEDALATDAMSEDALSTDN